MSLTTINCGQWHPDLEQKFFHDLNSLKRVDPLCPVVVLIGSRLLADYLLWRSGELNVNCVNARFVTFASLSRDLNLRKIVDDPRVELPNSGETIAVVKALTDLPLPHYFQDISEQSGFHNALTNSFGDLDHAGINRIDDSNSSFLNHNKFHTLSQLRNSYLGIVSRFRRSIDLLTADSFAETFQNVYGVGTLHIYGLYDFTALQRSFIRSLSRDTDLKVYLPYLNNSSAYRYAENGFKFYQSISSNCVVNALPSGEESSYGQYLFQYKHRYKQSGNSDNGHLCLFRSVDRSAEIDSVVGRINELILWEDVPTQEIGVLLWNPAEYLAPLCDAFDRAKLPFANMIGTRLDVTEEATALIAILTLAQGKIKRKSVVDLLATFDLKLDALCDPVAWEIISVEAGIVEGDRNGWQSALNVVKDRLTQKRETEKSHQNSTIVAQNELFQQFIGQLFDCFSRIPSKGSWKEFCDGAIHLIETFIIDGDNKSQIKDVVNSLSDLDAIDDVAKFDRFLQTLQSALGTVSIKSGRYRIDGITICDRMTARGVNFDILFMPGLVQGSVPVIPREDPILTDSERMRLNRTYSNSNEYPLPLKLSRSDEEKMLFALAVDSARKKLYLSFPANRLGGKASLPSRFIAEICRIVSGKSVEADNLHELPFFEDDVRLYPPFVKRLTDPDRYISEWMRANLKGSQLKNGYSSLYRGRSDQFDRTVQLLNARQRGQRLTFWDGIVSHGHDQNKEKIYSVTSLERYAACPFRYLVQDIYRANVWEEPELLLKPPPAAIGSMIHRVLEVFFKSGANSAKVDESVSRIVSSTINWAKRNWYAPESVWSMEAEFLQSRLGRFIKKQLESEDRFVFDTAERKIEGKVRFDVCDGVIDVYVKGKIDRVDLTPDRRKLRIVDYKTGTYKPSKADLFLGGCNLQLPLYLKTVAPTYDNLDFSDCEAQYLHIDQQGDSSNFTLTGKIINERDKDLGIVVKSVTEGIADGLFPPFPHDPKKMCSSCPVSSACDKRSRKSVSFRLDDARLTDLIAARRIA